MHCLKCNKENGFTIRGLCIECAPRLHQSHNLIIEEIGTAAKSFEAQTGKEHFSDWYGFENHIEKTWQGRSDIEAAFKSIYPNELNATQSPKVFKEE